MGLVLIVGVGLRLAVSRVGYNYDFESYKVVARLVDDWQNVYAGTSRYNYGPAWFNVLHLFSWIAHHGHNYEAIFRAEIVFLLTGADATISWLLYKRYGAMAGVLFFLNPISIVITGYHNQFDQVAIAIGLASLSFFERAEAAPRGLKSAAIGCALLGISITIKHVLVFFPLWIAFRQVSLRAGLLALFLPYLIFFGNFLPYWDEGKRGIIDNVIHYKSLNNAPFYHFIVPQFLHHLFSPMSLFLGGLAAGAWWMRKKPLIESYMWYLVLLVMLSPAIANQYLAIVMPAIVALRMWGAVAFVGLVTAHLWFYSPAGLYLADAPSGSVTYEWIVLSLLAGAMLKVFEKRIVDALLERACLGSSVLGKLRPRRGLVKPPA